MYVYMSIYSLHFSFLSNIFEILANFDCFKSVNKKLVKFFKTNLYFYLFSSLVLYVL
jgi:hypothetical protein